MNKFLITGLMFAFSIPLKSQWSDYGELNLSRSSTQAVTKDNKIYLIGGYERQAVFLPPVVTSSMEIIDEQNDTVKIVPLPNGSNRFSAVASGDKGVYMFSGGNWGGLTKRCFRYANDTFVEIDTLPEAITLFSAVNVGSKIILGGGNFGALNSFSNRIYIYDENTEKWSIDSISVARQYYGMATDGKKVYFAGGWDVDTSDHVSNLIDIWDVANDVWTTDSLSIARAAVCGGYLNGKIFFAGGWYSGTGNSSDVVDIFDGTSWKTDALSTPRGDIRSTALGNELFFVGGGDWSEFYLNFLQSSNAYDIYNDADKSFSSGETKYSHFEGGVAATESSVYAAGGLIQEGGQFIDYVKEIEVYSIKTGFKDRSFPKKIIYPNPSNGKIHISGISQEVDFKVYNVLGHLIISGSVSAIKNQIDLSFASNGIYYLIIEGQTEKIIIQ